MADYDLVIRGGTVVTASDQFRADVGVRGGRIAALADGLRGDRELDATLGEVSGLAGVADHRTHLGAAVEQRVDDGAALLAGGADDGDRGAASAGCRTLGIHGGSSSIGGRSASVLMWTHRP